MFLLLGTLYDFNEHLEYFEQIICLTDYASCNGRVTVRQDKML